MLRDPLWNTIRLDRTALAIIDTTEFQRLRGIRQLGLAHLVYPGATHTRFDHALGVYHLARQALILLGERGELREVDPGEVALVPYAALLHDIGHYPFSHALEELGPGGVLPGMHEELAGDFLRGGIAEALRAVSQDAPERIAALIQGSSDSPLQGLVSGSLDLDKIEYLRRDAFFTGVPYGEVDTDRLLHALTLLRCPESGQLEVGIHEKATSALESLLFAKYQMFRNVYWHHAVRAATVLFTRLVEDALAAGIVRPAELVGRTDEGLLALLEHRTVDAGLAHGPATERIAARWLPALRGRRLPKRAAEIPGEALRVWGLEAACCEARLQRALESRLADEVGLPRECVWVDYPSKPRMMDLNLLVLRRDGRVQRLESGGRAGLIDLPRVADELYHTARVFRVFTTERRTLAAERVLGMLGEEAGSE